MTQTSQTIVVEDPGFCVHCGSVADPMDEATAGGTVCPRCCQGVTIEIRVPVVAGQLTLADHGAIPNRYLIRLPGVGRRSIERLNKERAAAAAKLVTQLSRMIANGEHALVRIEPETSYLRAIDG
jgi:hypothetical protein